ncbi:uncharacterized protein [Antedon mediterranea]|uniref:uncharacterized protein n=1 Tax=Antedon mediterranea TaxID=105859 RepID=UPI003AF87364
MHTTNVNGTVCVAATVGELITISALCEDGPIANATVIPETTGDCVVGTCSEVALILQCREQTTQLPESFTTPYAMGCVHIQTCGDDQCNIPIERHNISISKSDSVTMYMTNDKGRICAEVPVGETVNVSAVCFDDTLISKTVTISSPGSCSENDCFDVLLECISSSTVAVPTTNSPLLLVIECPADVTLPTGVGLNYAIVELDEPTISGAYGDFYVNVIPEETKFPIGQHNVSYTAQDSLGRHASCVYYITIADMEPPRITCPSNINTMLAINTNSIVITWNDAIATDNAGGVTVIPFASNMYVSGDSFEEGEYTLMYVAIDDEGLISVCSFTIEITGASCNVGFFRCPEKCIADRFKCDGLPDCQDAFDESEENCGSCLSTEFRCPNSSKCIQECYVCDNYFDCYNNAEEEESFCSGFCKWDISIIPEAVIIEGTKCNFGIGENITYSCFNGYTLVGMPVSPCLIGGVFQFPSCYADCPQLSVDGVEITGSYTHGSNLQFVCEMDGYELIPTSAVATTCNNGIYDQPAPRGCRDIDECTKNPYTCDQIGTCINEDGGFRCECPDGYVVNGTQCNDINECLLINECAEIGSMCFNSDGSYTCECGEGYFGDGYNCEVDFFFPWGTEQGDDSLNTLYELSSNDIPEKVSPTFKPTNGFPFHGDFIYSIYCTENGAIVLSQENAPKYGLANPPTDGLYRNYPFKVIAPFWADSDLSGDIGEVYYNVYQNNMDTGGERDIEMLALASNRTRQFSSQLGILNLDDNWMGKWMLVVTWEKIPQYPVENNDGKTATFQAALITDGVYSFTLFNYEINGMKWNPDVLDKKNVIIGYGVGVNGEYNNVQLDSNYFPTANSRYSPDSTSNTGLNGQWFFRLEMNTEDTVNYRQYCMDWRNTESSNLWWLSGFGVCPCVHTQSSNDLSFGNSRRGRASRTSSVSPELVDAINAADGNSFCLQTQVASWSGAGMTCCYRGDGSLIEGYGGNVFSSSFVERYHFVDNNFFLFFLHFYLDWIPRYVCCSESNDPYYCNLYAEVRPKGTCQGYIPPNIGWVFGDPHMRTLDGLEYTFNAMGEFLLLNVNDEFMLQGRMQKFRNDVDATVFTAIAAQAGFTKVEFKLNSNASDFEIVVNGSIAVNKTDLGTEPYVSESDSTFSISLPSGNSTDNRVVAAWSSGISLSIGLVKTAIDVVASIPDSYKGQTNGLYGVWNDNVTDDFLLSNGTTLVIEPNTTVTDIYALQFGSTWRTTNETSLFTYVDGETWYSVNNLTFKPALFEDLVQNHNGTDFYDQAVKMCGNDRTCLFDTLITSDLSFGEITKSTNENNNNNLDELDNFPPNITSVLAISPPNALNGTNQLLAMVGIQYILRVVATDPEDSPVTYSLEDSVPGAGIDTDGVFTWTPLATDQVKITLVAMDDQGAAASFPLDVIICNCENGGVCNFNALVERSDLLNNHFAVSECECTPAWTGFDCSEDYDGCLDNPCYPGVTCTDQMAPLINVTCSTCPGDLIGNGFKCYDFDECTEGHDREDGVPFCQQECTNTLGSYTCSCREGYVLNVDLKNCDDIDECMMMTDDCSEYATCENTEGSFNCTCSEGYNGNGQICNNINECNMADYPCDENADCTDTSGSYICQCVNGYEGDGKGCQDINECTRELHSCDMFADCINTQGSYRCSCLPGWTGNGSFCEDINECFASVCGNRSICENTPGSYFCSCPSGYVGDGSTCIDVDECSSNTHDCLETSRCSNTNGGFDCPCKPGYELNNEECSDINECLANNTCGINAHCSNTPGSFVCTCQSGYSLVGNECKDIDECQLGINDCHQMCNNTVGHYSCYCNNNYELRNDSVSCQPIQGAECNTDPCVNAFCSMNGNDVSCLCKTGYEAIDGNTTHCLNVNECTNTTHMCSDVCIDTDGSYNCSCGDGYALSADLRNCEDINECDFSSSCDQNAMCANAPGTYICSCNLGYLGNGKQCEDVDECEHIRVYCTGNETCEYGRCDDAAYCDNNNGSYMCHCNDGYTGNGMMCFDINECSTMPCDSMATCTNTPGDYSCTCNSGFVGDGETCEDINECHVNSSCHTKAECTNIVGSYQCMCVDGYRGDGSKNCTNIDECTDNTNDCHQQATCTDTPGSFSCMCNPGFNGTGQICENVDECTLNQDNCDTNALCIDSEGSYACVCNAGYFSSNGGSGIIGNCDDVDECQLNVHNCSDEGTCQNVVSGFKCSCNDGYSGNGVECADINECEIENPCDSNENKKCENTQGNYTCICMINFVNENDVCIGALTIDLVVNFTDIKGMVASINPGVLNSYETRTMLAEDVYQLMKSTNISDSILHVSVANHRQVYPYVEVTLRIDFPVSTNIKQTDIVTAFFGELTGSDNMHLPPDNNVDRTYWIIITHEQDMVTITQLPTYTEISTNPPSAATTIQSTNFNQQTTVTDLSTFKEMSTVGDQRETVTDEEDKQKMLTTLQQSTITETVTYEKQQRTMLSTLQQRTMKETVTDDEEQQTMSTTLHQRTMKETVTDDEEEPTKQ